jgi:hypothetical protein
MLTFLGKIVRSLGSMGCNFSHVWAELEQLFSILTPAIYLITYIDQFCAWEVSISNGTYIFTTARSVRQKGCAQQTEII